MRIFYSQIDQPEEVYVKGQVYGISYTKDRKAHHVRVKVTKVGANSLFVDEVDEKEEPTGTRILRRFITGDQNYIVGHGYTIVYRDGKTKSITGKVLAMTTTQIIVEEAGTINHKF